MEKTERGNTTIPEATFARIGYGPDPLNTMSVWLAEAADPCPVVLTFQAGGFRTGRARLQPPVAPRPEPPLAQSQETGEPLRVKKEIMGLLAAGITVIAPAHRMPHTDPAPAQFQDAARALQFVRSKAADWNLDKDRIAATGASSGACLSLWLGCHDIWPSLVPKIR